MGPPLATPLRLQSFTEQICECIFVMMAIFISLPHSYIQPSSNNIFTFSYLDTLFHYLGKIGILAKRKGFQLRLLGYEMVV